MLVKYSAVGRIFRQRASDVVHFGPASIEADARLSPAINNGESKTPTDRQRVRETA